MEIKTKEGVFFMGPSDTFSAILNEPRECVCGCMAAFVVNRDGKTRCVNCDVKYQDSKRESSI